MSAIHSLVFPDQSQLAADDLHVYQVTTFTNGYRQPYRSRPELDRLLHNVYDLAEWHVRVHEGGNGEADHELCCLESKPTSLLVASTMQVCHLARTD